MAHLPAGKARDGFVVKRLKPLHNNPRPLDVKKLTGEDDLYRIREGDFRIICAIQDRELIVGLQTDEGSDATGVRNSCV